MLHLYLYTRHINDGSSEIAWNEIDVNARPVSPDLKQYVDNHLTDIIIDEFSIKVMVRKRAIKLVHICSYGLSSFYQGISVSYRECFPGFYVPPSRKTILLLHGSETGSTSWQYNMPTMAFLASAGHRAVAVDLPG